MAWKVYGEWKRSGTLCDLMDIWIERGFLPDPRKFSLNPDFDRETREIMRHKDAKLVARQPNDVQSVAIARVLRGALVMTCEKGLKELCSRRHVPTVDLFDFLSFLYCRQYRDLDTLERSVARWTRPDAGNGRPSDYGGSFSTTFKVRFGNAGCTALAEHLGVSTIFHSPETQTEGD